MDWFRYADDYYAGWLPQQILLPAAILINAAVVIFMGVHLLRRARVQPSPTQPHTPAATITKYELGARLYHWGNAAFTVGLIVSGAALMVPGSLRPLMISWLRIHEVLAGLFTAGLILHVVVAPLRGEGRSMWFHRSDWRDLQKIFANFFGLSSDYPAYGKYDPLQKLYHAYLTLASAALLFTGVFLFLNAETLSRPSHEWMRWMRLIHDLASVTFVALVLGHLYFALIPSNRAEFWAIITGRLSLATYRRKHLEGRWRPRKDLHVG